MPVNVRWSEMKDWETPFWELERNTI